MPINERVGSKKLVSLGGLSSEGGDLDRIDAAIVRELCNDARIARVELAMSDEMDNRIEAAKAQRR